MCCVCVNVVTVICDVYASLTAPVVECVMKLLYIALALPTNGQFTIIGGGEGEAFIRINFMQLFTNQSQLSTNFHCN